MAMASDNSTSTVTYRDVEGFPGYRVGDDGTVWSCRRMVGLGYGGGWKVILEDVWKRLKACPDTYGYPQVNLGPGRNQRPVHQLVLEAFVGPCPPGMECRHGDGDRANNRLSNLSWATHAVNMGDRRKHLTGPRGEAHKSAKLTAEEVLNIRARHATGVSINELKRQHGVSRMTITGIVRRKTWSHLP
jgi:HNH endonuclease